MRFLKVSYLRPTLSKTFEIFMHASLAKAFMLAKFQVKIRNYAFAAKLRFC